MKKLITSMLLVTVFTVSAIATKAQQTHAASDSASWQLVSNTHDKSKVTVQFYTNAGVLMYEETVYNRKLNITKKKTVRQLNAVLQQVYNRWVMNGSKTAETDLIARRLN